VWHFVFIQVFGAQSICPSAVAALPTYAWQLFAHCTYMARYDVALDFSEQGGKTNGSFNFSPPPRHSPGSVSLTTSDMCRAALHDNPPGSWLFSSATRPIMPLICALLCRAGQGRAGRVQGISMFISQARSSPGGPFFILFYFLEAISGAMPPCLVVYNFFSCG